MSFLLSLVSLLLCKHKHFKHQNKGEAIMYPSLVEYMYNHGAHLSFNIVFVFYMITLNMPLVYYFNIGRFYYDKSTKTLYKYSHDRLEIRHKMHTSRDREKKRKKKRRRNGWQPFCFAECVDIKLEEVVQLIYHLKIYLHSTCIIVIIIIYIICMILT